MSKRTLVVLLLVVAAAVVVAALWFPLTRPAPPAAARPGPAPDVQVASPRQVVIAYLEALGRGEFQTAYDHLSAESRKAHSYDGFVALCEKTGVPSYDLAGAAEKPAEEQDRVTVTVPLAEDPAEAGFATVRENGTWKVVFLSGAPSFPYP